MLAAIIESMLQWFETLGRELAHAVAELARAVAAFARQMSQQHRKK